ncbi:PepSY domain-containing protein [Methanobacterium petrolearium]|uniref:PepSY domain-containing protein n=1 Tax=Methanobacterium petrolearium TaxID=710190 RepID=UPI001AEA781C|nr:PepSY domain-containing protein [Methanobacterium petrolearium]MBP1946818.1 putative membrane protein YkoI [Methanobacterium petrolearium]BDZ69796.1 hypothetical protein GCM10025861_03130 [Methanobacterium petrolearium]
MIKKSTRILALVGVMLTVLAVVALALAVFGSSENNPPEEIISTDNSDNTTITDSTDNVKITSTEAQQIAEKYIKEVGATVGIPKLEEIDGEMVYIVPVVINGTNVGEIDINAMTGENMGGAGGVSV